MASNGQFAGTRDQNSGEKRILTVDGDGTQEYHDIVSLNRETRQVE